MIVMPGGSSDSDNTAPVVVSNKMIEFVQPISAVVPSSCSRNTAWAWMPIFGVMLAVYVAAPVDPLRATTFPCGTGVARSVMKYTTRPVLDVKGVEVACGAKFGGYATFHRFVAGSCA